MNGTSDTLFSPNAQTARAMIVTVLYRLEGSPSASADSGFADIAKDAYYAKAVAWAQQNSIVKGYSDTAFGPNDNITREQLALILINYAKYKGHDVSAKGDLTTFGDRASVSDWAAKAVNWAGGEGLISGKGNGILDSAGKATRAETAIILKGFMKTVAK